MSAIAAATMNENHQSADKVVPLRIDCLDLHMKVSDLSRFLCLRLMENCISKVEQSAYRPIETFWMKFIEEVKGVNLLDSLQQVSFFEGQREFKLSEHLSLGENLERMMVDEAQTSQIRGDQRTPMERLEKVCLVLDFHGGEEEGDEQQ